MIGCTGPIEEQTVKNTYFRQVLFTGKHAQLVVMSLHPGEQNRALYIPAILVGPPVLLLARGTPDETNSTRTRRFG